MKRVILFLGSECLPCANICEEMRKAKVGVIFTSIGRKYAETTQCHIVNCMRVVDTTTKKNEMAFNHIAFIIDVVYSNAGDAY